MRSLSARLRRSVAPLPALLAALLSTIGCASASDGPGSSVPSADGGPSASAPTDAGRTPCPASPPTIGATCSGFAEGRLCDYGYAPLECGGRTVSCRRGAWVEEYHTDPQPSCASVRVDAGAASADAGDGPVGGGCTYAREPGIVTITAIEVPGPNENDCANDPKRVVVRFEGTGSNVVRTGTLTINGGANPPSSCLATEGLTVGAKLPATLARIQTGTCTPELIEFARAFPSCTAACF